MQKINPSYESDIQIVGKTVLKKYKAEYHALNGLFGRCGEAYWYSALNTDFFLNPLEATKDYIVLPLVGEAIGTVFGLDPVEQSERNNLIVWLIELERELVKLEVAHHDINPGNILRDKNLYKLIDLSWMTCLEDDFNGEPYMNLQYSRNDSRSIMQLIRQLERMP